MFCPICIGTAVLGATGIAKACKYFKKDNMKTLKFREKLSKLILEGEKDTTWRLFDDKNLSVGDEVRFLIWDSLEEFVKVKLLDVRETVFGKLTEEDWEGHEKFESEEEMYKTYSKYYNCKVDENSPVKIIKFKIIQD